jgi:hypothetical protein
MTIRDQLGRIDRLQHGLWFKVVVSCVIVAMAIAAGVTYAVAQAAKPMPTADMSGVVKPADPPKDANLTPEQREELELAKSRYEATEATARTINDILARKADPTVVFVGIGVVAALAMGVAWLGITLTILAVALAICAVVWPLYALGGSQSWAWASNHRQGLQDAARFTGGLGSLTLSFFILMEMLKLALGGPWAITAIARNVVSEAVRMKVAIVFIVMLLLGLAALPGLLDDSTPLRYRVQSFLQYGTGGTFWVIAILVLFLSVATVAFEQRDKIIWQTMTKPVAPWQYLLGKWLGVVGIAAVLLTVTASGVFLFTGYLRNQRAGGEEAAYVARDKAITEDRLVLETQVLAARVAILPLMPKLEPADEEAEVVKLLKKAQEGDKFFLDNEENRGKLRMLVRGELVSRYLSMGPGESQVFRFTGLEEIKAKNRPMTLRYKVSVGADDPRETARVTFILANQSPRVQEVPLGQSLTIPISAGSIEVIPPATDKNGNPIPGSKTETALDIQITNGDLYQRMAGAPDQAWMNKERMTLPPDGLELSFPVGGYEANFLRVMVVLWLKLAFLAMVGVCAATHLSFAVASLMAFGTFLIAESASFLSTSLEYFNADDGKGNIEYWKALVRAIALPIAATFKSYAELKPTANLVDGRMVDWTTVAIAGVVLGALVGVLYAVAVTIFRKRELATYSGQ